MSARAEARAAVDSYLKEALRDCVNECDGTRPDDHLFVDIAADYGLHPELLKRKFYESYPSGCPGRLPTEQDRNRKMLDRVILSYLGGHLKVAPKVEVFQGSRLLGVWHERRRHDPDTGQEIWVQTFYAVDEADGAPVLLEIDPDTGERFAIRPDPDSLRD